MIKRHWRLTALTFAAVFGLLLWARLILVTGYPRTAIAAPEHAAEVLAPQSAVP